MITIRTTHHFEVDLAVEAWSREEAERAARNWLLELDQDPADWLVECTQLHGPGAGWPVVSFGHPDRDMVEALEALYDGMA